MGNISRSTFAHLPALKILNLSKNSIGHVEASALSHNRLLQAVRLDQVRSVVGRDSGSC